MYIPRSFAEDDPETLYQIMREDGFALLISTGDDGPVVTHLPLMLELADDGGAVLCGHMARANPHLDLLADKPDALAVFSGPHGYVSPSWYGTAPAVPTWNYAAVHAQGRISLIDDPAVLAPMLDDLVGLYEDHRETPWRMADLPAEYRARQIAAIVGFRMPITRLEGKLKLSQNRPAADAALVADALAREPSPDARRTADAMRRYGVVGDDRK
jgi:transcriptional regulator